MIGITCSADALGERGTGRAVGSGRGRGFDEEEARARWKSGAARAPGGATRAERAPKGSSGKRRPRGRLGFLPGFCEQ